MPALIDFQFHLIARIDDTTQVIMDHIRVHDEFDYALKTQGSSTSIPVERLSGTSSKSCRFAWGTRHSVRSI